MATNSPSSDPNNPSPSPLSDYQRQQFPAYNEQNNNMTNEKNNNSGCSLLANDHLSTVSDSTIEAAAVVTAAAASTAKVAVGDGVEAITHDKKGHEFNVAHQLLAGSAASVVARFCVSPLDVLKIRFQIQEHGIAQSQYRSIHQAIGLILRQEGLTAFWKGNMAAELMVVPYGAVSFMAYSKTKELLKPLQHRGHHHLSSLISGSSAGFFATVATYPLDLMRTRFAAQQEPKLYRSLWHAASSVWLSEGFRGFYVGMWPTLCGIVPLMALQFGCYETMKHGFKNMRKAKEKLAGTYDKHKAHSVTMLEQTICGFTSGVVSKLLTMPLDVIKKRYQVSGFHWESSSTYQSHLQAIQPSAAIASSPISSNAPLSSTHSFSQPSSVPLTMNPSVSSSASSTHSAIQHPPYHRMPHRKPFNGVIDCARGILRHEGWRGLFKGCLPTLLKAGPNSALIYVVYEQTLKHLRSWEKQHKHEEHAHHAH